MLTIVDASEFPLDDLVLHYVPESDPLPSELIDAHHRGLIKGGERFKADVAEGKEQDNLILCLQSISYPPLTFDTASLSYGEYAGLRNYCNDLLSESKTLDPRLLLKRGVLSMITLVETSDDYLIIGHRQGSHLANTYLSPSSFYKHSGKLGYEFLRKTIFDAVQKSIGIQSFQPINYLGTCHDSRDSFLFVHVFYQKLLQNAREVYDNWKKIEKPKHDHLLFVPGKLVPLTDYLRHQGEHVFNPFAPAPISFVRAEMVAGPKEHEKKEIKHIENGVGSLLLYIVHRFSKQPEIAIEIGQTLVSERIISALDSTALAARSSHTVFLEKYDLLKKSKKE